MLFWYCQTQMIGSWHGMCIHFLAHPIPQIVTESSSLLLLLPLHKVSFWPTSTVWPSLASPFLPTSLAFFLTPFDLLFLGISAMLERRHQSLRSPCFSFMCLPLLPPLTQAVLSGLCHQHLLKSLWKSSTVPTLRKMSTSPWLLTN